MNLLALFQPKPTVVERVVYSRSAKAAADYLAKRRAMHAKLIDETLDDDARIEMQRTLFGIPAVRDGLGV